MQPIITSKQVQSSAVRPSQLGLARLLFRPTEKLAALQPSAELKPHSFFALNQPKQSATQLPICNVTIRHGFAMIPLNSRCTPTAWPNIPTYAVNTANNAAQ